MTGRLTAGGFTLRRLEFIWGPGQGYLLAYLVQLFITLYQFFQPPEDLQILIATV